jgi:hypothetical protein
VPRKLALLGACALATVLAACGSDDAGVSPDEAATTLSEQLGLPESQRQCLRARFEENERARGALETEDPSGDEGLDALGAVVLDCVPSETLASSLARLLAGAYATTTDVDDADRQCLEDQIAALPRERQVLFVTGPVARSAQIDSDASLEVSALLDEVTTACGIGPAPPTSAPMEDPAVDEGSTDGA